MKQLMRRFKENKLLFLKSTHYIIEVLGPKEEHDIQSKLYVAHMIIPSILYIVNLYMYIHISRSQKKCTDSGHL